MRVLKPLYSAILLAVACSQAQAMTLSEAIQSTVDNHPELHASVNDRLSADEDVKVAKGGYLPTVDLIAGYGREQTDSPSTRALGNHNKETLNYSDAELRLRQMLFDGFNTPNEVARTQATVNSRAYYIQGTAESLALRTVEVYLEVLKRREMVALARNNLQAHERVNDQIKLRSERGVGSTADLDQSEARLALAANNLYTEEVNLADAEANFFSSTGRLPDELEQPASVKGEVPENIELARQTVMDNNPYLKSAQADVYAAEKQYEVAKAPFYPRFDLELATSADDNVQGDEGHYNTWRAAVVMNYNLFNGMRDKARLQGAAHKINQSMDIRNNALRVLNENLALAWNAMENARMQTPKARDYADYTARSREAYQQQFSLGQRTLLDLLDSENELFTANRRYTEVRYTEEFSMYRVISAMGELLRKQNVVVPAEAVALTEVKSEARLPEMR
ncbi:MULTISPECIES: TolC family outer membrane protein [Pseudomonadaceae]|jgi:adhesin transport system outer membrane protein|uniref:Outer membrane protein n=1 Tax=Aquipseudomonas alcaligenes (strain ATCC 14909 / DSM 50342 / CCUG 1425 / JCM 20561 / NBRC 14159 / NCIMB 9945 / NCTC 10367 / 1577) TaxID=1215092 RepID=U3BDK6_AQUA1|nr:MULTISPECIES: TolC family outer membrane protein [Pseudomonas]AMR67690.1 channel protein TolC [Pseudomonas alcaligenes]MDC7825644.1 TolC family outer membrane protein [Pseudomonas sp. BLCC-B13]MEE1949657.1 TolC family outer membrane protein [Pseudomonas alcaligenes]SUD17624.1 TolC family type I secretion outer membrane protein [Pseudomonas alcaligenes]GAD64833.1 putative outer membrane protein [Pseudomonas alcaligenes NBRC 14159]